MARRPAAHTEAEPELPDDDDDDDGSQLQVGLFRSSWRNFLEGVEREIDGRIDAASAVTVLICFVELTVKLSTDWSAYAPTRTVNDLTELWVETDRKKLEDRSGRDKLPVTSACAQLLRQAEELLLLQKEPAEVVGNIGNIGKCPTGGGSWVSLLTLPPCDRTQVAGRR